MTGIIDLELQSDKRLRSTSGAQLRCGSRFDQGIAAALGFKTAFVARPLEHGSADKADALGDTKVDVVASDFLDLAVRLQA